MQGSSIIKNTVKQRPFYHYLQLIILYKPVKRKIMQTVRQNIRLMFLEGGLNKIRHIDNFFYKTFFDSSLKFNYLKFSSVQLKKVS